MALEVTERQFRELVAGIKLTDEARYIAIVTCNSPAGRRELIGRLQEALADEGIGLYAVQVTGEQTGLASTVARKLEEPDFVALTERYPKVAIAVNWQESAIPPEELEDKERTPTALQQLNLGREYFVEFGHPLIVVVPDYVHNLMAREAPDWYRIRTDAFEFRTAAEAAYASVAQLMTSGDWTVRSVEELEERIRTYEAALGRLEGRTGGRERELRARLLSRLGGAHYMQGQYGEGLALLAEALELFGELADRDGEGQTLNNMAIIHQQQGQYEEAMGLYERSLEVSRAVDDRHQRAVVVTNMAGLAYLQGRYSEALELYQQGVSVFGELGDLHGEGHALVGMGLVQKAQGQYGRAKAVYEHSLRLFQELGDRQSEAGALGNVANVCAEEGRYEEAAELYRASLAIHEELGDRHGEGQTLGNIANVRAEQGYYEKAVELYEESLHVKQQLGNRHGEGQTLMNMGLLAARTGELEKAREYWEAALEALDGLGVPEEERVRRWLAELETPAQDAAHPENA